MKLVTVPEDLWMGGESGSVANWFFEDGATVRHDDLLCEVMYEKATNEIRAPAPGLLRIRAPTESIVYKGDTLAVIEPAP